MKNNEQHKIHGNELRPAPPADHVTDDSEKLRPSLSNTRTASQVPPKGVSEKLRPSFSNQRTASEAPLTGVGEKLRPSLSNTNTVLHTPPIDVGEQPRPFLSRTDSDNDVRGRYMLRKRKGVTYRDARPYVAKEK